MLKCALANFAVSDQQALGASMAAPPRLVAGAGNKLGMMLASAAQAADNGMAAPQETKSADATAEPQASVLEHKSTLSLPSRKQRRRKPQMAGVPAGSPSVARVDKKPELQAVAQESKEPVSQVMVSGGKEPKSPAVAQESKEPASQVMLPGVKEPEPPAVAQKPGEPGIQAAEPEDEKDMPDKSLASVPGVETKSQDEVRRPDVVAAPRKRYAMAPIRWAVRVTESLGLLSQTITQPDSVTQPGLSATDKSKTLSHVQTAEIKLATYIIQPYIAQVKGSIGVASSTSKIDTVSTMSSTSNNNTRNNNLFGKGELSLFSRSRFPFRMALASSDNHTNSKFIDSRANPELIDDNTINKSLSMHQGYRPQRGPSRYEGGYSLSNSKDTLSDKNSLSGRSSTNSMLDGRYTTRLGKDVDQPFMTEAVRTVYTESPSGSNTSMNRLGARHTYLPKDSLLSLNTNAELTTTSQGAQSQPSLKSQYLQVASLASWQPESEDIPLFLTGSGQFFNLSSSSAGGGTNTARSLSGAATASYLASSKLSYNASMSVMQSVANNKSILITTEGGGATYRGDTINIGKASYSWNTAGNASNTTGPSPSRSASGLVGHSLNGPYALSLFGNKSTLRYGVNQSLVLRFNPMDGRSEVLANSGTLAWTRALSKGLSGGASVSASDVRTMGKNPSHTQIVIFGLNGLGKGGYSASGYGLTLEANATMVMSRNPQGGTDRSLVGNGIVTYQKQNVLGVRHLNYNAILSVSATPNLNPAQNLQGTTPTKPISYSLAQLLVYRVGQNQIALRGTLADQNGLKNASLLLQFSAWRTIGN